MNLAGVVGYHRETCGERVHASARTSTVFWQRGSILRSVFVAAALTLAACKPGQLPGTTQPEGTFDATRLRSLSSSSTVSTRLGPDEAPRYLYVASTQNRSTSKYNGANGARSY
jgi:hypothetical protein